MIVLTVREPQQPPYEVRIPLVGDAITIGRHPLSHVLLDDPGVSVRHCEIRVTGGIYEIADLESSNGIVVDGEHITRPTRLSPGARIRLGATTIRLNFVDRISADVSGTLEVDPGLFTQRLARYRVEEIRASHPPSGPPSVIVDAHDLGATLEWGADPRPGSAGGDRAKMNRTLTLSALGGSEVPPTLTSRPLLRIIGGHAERTFILRDGSSIIGRDATSDIVIEDRRVSRRHARITVQGDDVSIERLSERRPLRVNNVGVRDSTRLAEGDLIRVGPAVLEFARAGVDPRSNSTAIHGRFVVGEDTFDQQSLLIGRAPRCDVTLDDASVEDEHLQIERSVDGRFRLRERGYRGVHLNGRPTIESWLDSGDRIGFGDFGLRVTIDADVCRLDLVAGHARSIETFVTGAHTGTHPKVTALDAAPTEEPARRPEVWTPPGDVRRRAWGPLLVVLGLLTGLSGTALLESADDGGLLDRRLSTAHSGDAFDLESEGTGCAACHVGGTHVASRACSACHADREPRVSHRTVSARLGADGLRCADCHREHADTPSGALPAATDGCGNPACHAKRHEALQGMPNARLPFGGTPARRLRERAPELSTIGAERFLMLRRPEGVAALHASHGAIERRCLGCHADEQGGAADAPATLCFRCHEGRAASIDSDCDRCHEEHEALIEVPDANAPAVGGSAPVWSTARGLAVTFLVLAPVCLLVGLRWVFADWTAEAFEHSDPPDPKMEIHISEALCVGSNACVEQCPYDVLVLVERSNGRRIARVANFESCNECNVCAEVCQPEALVRIVPGEPVPGLMRPDIDANFMTRVPGLYLIGQAAGVPLVRNAINLGARTVHHMCARGLDPVQRALAGLQFDIAIIGAGPAGLSAAMTAHELGLTAVVFEKASALAPTIRGFHEGKPVQSQPADVELIGSMWIDDCTREELLERWDAQLEAVPLDLRCGHRVETIEPVPAPVSGSRVADGFRVTTADGHEVTAARAIIAIGGGEPRRLIDVPGHDLPHVSTQCTSPAAHDGDHICVVGGGNSALEVAAACAEANGGSNTVHLVYRKSAFTRASRRNRERVDALAARGRLTLHLSSTPIEFREKCVVIENEAGSREVTSSKVYTMLGRITPERWLQSLGIQYVERPRDWAPARSDDLGFLHRKGET